MRGADWTSANQFSIVADARRFENWEFAFALVLGLGEAARYAIGVGIDSSGKRARALAARIRSRLADLPGFQVLDKGTDLAALVTVTISGWDSLQVVNMLRERKINTTATLREYAVIDMDHKHAKSAVRISPHYYNTEEETESVVEALKEIACIGC